DISRGFSGNAWALRERPHNVVAAVGNIDNVVRIVDRDGVGNGESRVAEGPQAKVFDLGPSGVELEDVGARTINDRGKNVTGRVNGNALDARRDYFLDEAAVRFKLLHAAVAI